MTAEMKPGTPLPWVVATTILGTAPMKSYEFRNEGEARMFVHMLTRDGERCELRRIA